MVFCGANCYQSANCKCNPNLSCFTNIQIWFICVQFYTWIGCTGCPKNDVRGAANEETEMEFCRTVRRGGG